MERGNRMDTGVRDFFVSTAQRWTRAPRLPDDPLRAVDQFDDAVIRLKSGRYVFKGDLHRAKSLASVPVYSYSGGRPCMSGILDRIPSMSDLLAFTVMGFFFGAGWLMAGLTYNAIFSNKKG